MVENKDSYEMKTLLTPLLLILIALPSYASELPPCPKDQTQVWDNCFGTYSIEGDKYVGEFKDDKYHGNGTYTWADGNKYVGEHKDGKRHGNGTHTLTTGASYVGEYKDGHWHGKGTYTNSNGETLSGIFANTTYLYESVESARSDCAKEAGKAGTEYAAKQIEKTCLAEKQLEPES